MFLRKRYGIPYDISIEFIESNVLPYISILNLGNKATSKVQT